LQVIHASFYTWLEQISMHYRSTFLYIIGAHFYTLLLAAGDAASLFAEDPLVAMYVQTWMYNEISMQF
jgi:hypothetical protein